MQRRSRLAAIGAHVTHDGRESAPSWGWPADRSAPKGLVNVRWLGSGVAAVVEQTGAVSDIDPSSLQPGVLDAHALHAFRHGACEALAIALHDATGWPLVMITDFWNVHGDPDRFGIAQAGVGGSGAHWVVRADDGRLVDVDGAHDPGELARAYDGYVDEPGEDDDPGVEPGARLAYATREMALEEHIERKGGPVPHELAATYVAAVLERAGYRQPPGR